MFIFIYTLSRYQFFLNQNVDVVVDDDYDDMTITL